MCHAVRFPLNSDKYEEMFAYQTSTSKFRRLFGPMVRSPKESYVLLALIGILMLAQIWIYNQDEVDYTYFLPVPVLVLMSLMLAYFCFLMIRQHLQNKSYETMLENFREISDYPKQLSFRLTDDEIDAVLRIGKIKAQNFDQALKEVGVGSLRRKVLSSYLRR
jgi:hypothetical protein